MKIRSYLQLLGRRIDQIVLEHEEEPYKQDSMCFFFFLLDSFIIAMVYVTFNLCFGLSLFSFSCEHKVLFSSFFFFLKEKDKG